MKRLAGFTFVLVVVALMIAGSIMPEIADAHGHRHGRHSGYWGPYADPYWGSPYGGPYGPSPYLGCNPWNAWCSPRVYVPSFYSPFFVPQVVVPQVQERVIIQQAPQTYTEQPKPEQQFWYWCTKPEGYHPYVKTCDSAWLKVVPPTAPPQ